MVAAALSGGSSFLGAQASTATEATTAAPVAVATAEQVVPLFPVATVPGNSFGFSSTSSSTSAAEADAASLPEAPSAILQEKGSVALGTSPVPVQGSFFSGPHNSPSMPMERRYTKYIRPDHRGQPLNVREKVILGIRDSYSLGDLGATFISASYGQIANSQPNYGTDRGAYGARLGAAALREITEGIFTDSVFSVLEKEDPRYYAMGPKYGYVKRTMYAITRPLITRTDGGHSTPNGALLAGYASSAALALTYYPSNNRNFHDAASNFGTSIGGAALGFFVAEFQDDFLIALHLKKKP